MKNKKAVPAIPTSEEWSLDCSYFTESFQTLDALLRAVLERGTDPNHEILRNGQPTGETAWDLIEPEA